MQDRNKDNLRRKIHMIVLGRFTHTGVSVDAVVDKAVAVKQWCAGKSLKLNLGLRES